MHSHTPACAATASRTGKGVFPQRRLGPAWSDPTSNDMRTTLHSGLYVLRKSALTPSSGWPNFALTPYFIVKPKRWISWRYRTYRQFFIQKAKSPVQVHWTSHTYNDYFVKSDDQLGLCIFAYLLSFKKLQGHWRARGNELVYRLIWVVIIMQCSGEIRQQHLLNESLLVLKEGFGSSCQKSRDSGDLSLDL